MRIISLILMPWFLMASSVFTFSPKELLDYQKRYDPGVEKRAEGFLRSLDEIRHDARFRWLNRVNTLVNSYQGEFDAIVNQQEDYWSTPKEFLAAGSGDCEEYAITKYFALLALGYEDESLCLIVVKDRYSGGHHMVLGVYRSRQEEPMVLDNLSFRILPLSVRTDLEPLHCINQQGVFKLGKNGRRIRVNQFDKKFDDLMKRIAEGR